MIMGEREMMMQMRDVESVFGRERECGKRKCVCSKIIRIETSMGVVLTARLCGMGFIFWSSFTVILIFAVVITRR